MRLRINEKVHPAFAGVTLLILTLFVAACGSILSTETRYADKVRINITGTSAGPLVMVTSTNFIVGVSQTTGNEVVVVQDSTVTDITLPIEREYDFTSTYRFLVRVMNPDTMQEATVRMRVWLDDKMVNDQTVPIRSQPMQFTWRYF